MRHISDKIKVRWHPTNLHCITTPDTKKSSPENRLTSIRLLTPIWGKKKVCIFSKSTDFYLFEINEINLVLSPVAFCNHTLIYNI